MRILIDAPQCAICNGVLHRDNQLGVCKNTPECQREWWRRWRASLGAERRSERDRQFVESHHSTVVLRNAKQRAKSEGISYTLTHDTLPCVPATCPCCDAELLRKGGWRNQPSLDRKVPELGYVLDNVQWLCRRCNQLKSNATPEEMMRIALFMNGIT